MEKEKSNPYTLFILRYRLMNLQGGIFAFENEKNYGRRKNRKRSIGKLNSPYRLSGIYLQEISGAGIYFYKLEPRIPIQVFLRKLVQN